MIREAQHHNYQAFVTKLVEKQRSEWKCNFYRNMGHVNGDVAHEDTCKKIKKANRKCSECLSPIIFEMFFIEEIIEEQVLLKITSLKNRESLGHDLKPEFIKLVCQIFLKPLRFLYNMSINSRLLPLVW